MASGIEDYLLRVIAVDQPLKGPVPSLLRGFLGGCSRLYETALDAYLAAEKPGIRRRGVLPVPVLSIGNLTVGGTGKTPMTELLCRRLTEAGKRVGVLSRGHGGEGTEIRIVSDQDGVVRATAAEAGDEPVLLARSLPGIPVLTGKDRRLSGREALRRFSLDVLILDDGFQYWQLVRDFDLVLLDSQCPFDNGRSLPRGLLREPVRHLSRASMVVFTRSDSLDSGQRSHLRDAVAKHAPAIDAYFARHVPTCIVPLGTSDSPQLPLSHLDGLRVIALSGIAQPESFRRTLRNAAGVQIVDYLEWGDHHVPTPDDIETVNRLAAKLRADAIVMTEKDAVKWPPDIALNCPAYALRVEMRVDDEEKFLNGIQARLFRPTAIDAMHRPVP